MSSPSVGRPMEILLVEDSLLDARLTIGALKKADFRHRLTLVRDGEEALEFLSQQGKFARAPRPDLILLDLFLPKLDGIELLHRIKEDLTLQKIPVVVLTTSDTEEDKSRCQTLAVESYITKPVNVEKFLQVVFQLKAYWRADLVLPHAD